MPKKTNPKLGSAYFTKKGKRYHAVDYGHGCWPFVPNLAKKKQKPTPVAEETTPVNQDVEDTSQTAEAGQTEDNQAQ